MTKYELRKIEDKEQLFKIDKDEKEWAVPQDEFNSDYQAYLQWLENPTYDEQQAAQAMPLPMPEVTE
jgi:hypothetical protein